MTRNRNTDDAIWRAVAKAAQQVSADATSGGIRNNLSDLIWSFVDRWAWSPVQDWTSDSMKNRVREIIRGHRETL